MNSPLDPVLRTFLSPATPADTRQDIRRQEPEDGRRHGRRDKPDEEDAQDDWDDRVEVAVPALKDFLEQLLREAGVRPASETGPENAGSPAARVPDAAHAAQAYRRTVSATRAAQGAPLAREEEGVLALGLHPAEIEAIHGLIADLGALERRGVPAVTIVKSGTFLQSLLRAVRARLEAG